MFALVSAFELHVFGIEHRNFNTRRLKRASRCLFLGRGHVAHLLEGLHVHRSVRFPPNWSSVRRYATSPAELKFGPTGQSRRRDTDLSELKFGPTGRGQPAELKFGATKVALPIAPKVALYRCQKRS